MLKFIKIIASLLGIIVLLAIAAIIVLVTLVNPNDFKTQISEKVHHYTGRQLDLQGNIAWSFFPWLGVRLNDATLSNAVNFGAEPFAHIKHIDIKIKLLPLLQRQVEVGTLLLDGLEVHLVKNAQGVTNWQDLTSAAKTDSANDNKASPDKHHRFNFSIASVDINNGHITWVNQQKNQAFAIDDLELHSKDIKQNQLFPVIFQFTLQSKQPEINGVIEMDAQILSNPDQQNYLLKQLHMTSQFVGPTLPNKQLNLDLKGDVAINTKQQTTEGQLQSENLVLGPLTAKNFVVQFKSQQGNINLNPISAKIYQGDYNGNLQINLSNKTPVITSHSQLANIQAEPLFKDLANLTYLQLAGTGNMAADLTTQGDSAPMLIKNLNGRGRFALNNGVLHGINIPYWIGVGRSLIQKEPLPPVPTDLKQTNFGNLAGSFTVTKGVLQNQDLVLTTPQLQATGAGTADLVNQQIDYHLKAQLLNPSTLKPQGTMVPIVISGSFKSPGIRPEMKSILKNALQDQYQKNKEVIGQQLQKFLGKDTGAKIQNRLEDFFH